MSLEEAILEKVRRLPPAKQEEVLRFADDLQHRSSMRMVPSRDRSREMVWLKENRAKYANQWVVVEGDRLIAADADGHKAFVAAKARASKCPFCYTCFPKIRYLSRRVGCDVRMPPIAHRDRLDLVIRADALRTCSPKLGHTRRRG